jgi:hypothetical protein
MALYDSADCLQRCRDAAQLPDDDEQMTPAAWYRLLTSAQGRWFPIVAAHVPHVHYSAPELLESTDDGLTYPFGTDEAGRPTVPFMVQVFRREADAYQPNAADFALRNGVDYFAEATQIRFRLTGARPTFPEGGPWVRSIAPPGEIDGTHHPVLYPVHARELLVLDAVEQWATQGDLRDASVWRGRAQKYWTGDPANRLDVGLLGALTVQFPAPSSGRAGRLLVIPRGYPGMMR